MHFPLPNQAQIPCLVLFFCVGVPLKSGSYTAKMCHLVTSPTSSFITRETPCWQSHTRFALTIWFWETNIGYIYILIYIIYIYIYIYISKFTTQHWLWVRILLWETLLGGGSSCDRKLPRKIGIPWLFQGNPGWWNLPFIQILGTHWGSKWKYMYDIIFCDMIMIWYRYWYHRMLSTMSFVYIYIYYNIYLLVIYFNIHSHTFPKSPSYTSNISNERSQRLPNFSGGGT